MRSLAGKTAVITGATSGIGRAIALALAREKAVVHVVGRDPDTLHEVAEAATGLGGAAHIHHADLSIRSDVAALADELRSAFDRLDVLVHSAGVLAVGTVEQSSLEEMDLQYQVNVAAPYHLTRTLLPYLMCGPGQIVFINSSLGVQAKAGTAQYAATKHALKALADGLRQEVNERGVRVLSVYPGRTASRMQEALCRREGRPYVPENLLQPEDVAGAVLAALILQPSAEITDIHIRGMRKPPSAR